MGFVIGPHLEQREEDVRQIRHVLSENGRDEVELEKCADGCSSHLILLALEQTGEANLAEVKNNPD